LENTLIGVKFSETPNAKGIAPNLSICEALGVVKKENVIINLAMENCTCRGGRHFAGLQIVPVETISPILAEEGHRIYESKEVAETSVRKQPQPAYRGKFLILGPLHKFDEDPDLVLFIVNPVQADRILGLASFKGTEPFAHFPATSICSTITNTLAKGKPDINFISTFERKRGQWSPNELIIALPLKDFLIAVESIPHSGYGESMPS
jgi:uncharacterized protein (DUF169 family)